MAPLKVNENKNKAPKKESLWVNHATGEVKMVCSKLKFVDKETNMLVVYVPALDISGYGDNEEEASSMLNFSVEEYFEYITKLSAKKMEAELLKLGWKKNSIKHKEFSQVYVDINGKLNGFNAVENSIEIEEMTY